MERLVFEHSRAKNVGLLLLSLLLVAGGVFMAIQADTSTERVVGWIGTPFFSLGALVIARNLLRGGTAYVFDLSGIKDEKSGFLIPWSEVKECLILSVRGTRLLSVVFKNPDQFLLQVPAAKQKMARFNERMSWGHWSFSFVGITPGLDEAVRFIHKNVPNLPTTEA